MKSLPLRDFALLIALLLITLFFAWQSPAFLSAQNLSNLGVDFAITAVLALGVLLVLLPGQTDLATGSGAGLIGGMAAVLTTQHHWPAPLAMAVGAAVGVALWTAMGTLIVKQRLPAFIMTLAGLLVFRGLHWMMIGSTTVPVRIGDQENLLSLLTTWRLPPLAGWVLAGAVAAVLGVLALRDRARRAALGLALEDRDTAFARWLVQAQLLGLLVLLLNQHHGVPLAVLILGAVAVGVQVLTRSTPFGRALYAIGGNREAALLSGIRVDRTIIIAFALTGVAVALTGFLRSAYGGANTTVTGNLMELDAIAACVIGGVSLTGGKGSVAGVLFGALIMAVLLNGMQLMAVDPAHALIARGAVLALAVWMDVALARR